MGSNRRVWFAPHTHHPCSCRDRMGSGGRFTIKQADRSASESTQFDSSFGIRSIVTGSHSTSRQNLWWGDCQGGGKRHPVAETDRPIELSSNTTTHEDSNVVLQRKHNQCDSFETHKVDAAPKPFCLSWFGAARSRVDRLVMYRPTDRPTETFDLMHIHSNRSIAFGIESNRNS